MMQTTMTIQENGVFIQLPDYILANLQNNPRPTLVNFEFDGSGKLAMSLPVFDDFANKKHNISPEVKALAGFLQDKKSDRPAESDEQTARILTMLKADDEVDSHDITEVLNQLAHRKDLTISPEVARVMGSLKPHMATENLSKEEQEQAFLQAINEDDERIKAYGI